MLWLKSRQVSDWIGIRQCRPTLSTELLVRPLQVKTSIKQWFEDSSEDCSSIQILVLSFQTVNIFVFLGETLYSLGSILWKIFHQHWLVFLFNHPLIWNSFIIKFTLIKRWTNEWTREQWNCAKHQQIWRTKSHSKAPELLKFISQEYGLIAETCRLWGGGGQMWL